MRAGSNTDELKVLRRAPDADGNATGEFAPAFSAWATWTQNAGAMAAVAGQREDPIDLIARVNDSPNARTITNGDRAELRGRAYAIASVGLPERKSASIVLALRSTIA